MTTITVNVPDDSRSEVKKFIEELGGEILSESRSSKTHAVLEELSESFLEAKAIKEGKKEGLTLEALLCAK